MYNYDTEREKVFTEEGQRMFLQIRDRVKALLKQSGAVRLQEAIGGVTGDSWTMLACVDRLAELGELRLVHEGAVGQDNVYVAE